MTAPASDHAARLAKWDRLWLILLAEEPTDSAGPTRPLGAGDQPQTHDDQVTCPGKLDLVAEEDSRSGLATSAVD